MSNRIHPRGSLSGVQRVSLVDFGAPVAQRDESAPEPDPRPAMPQEAHELALEQARQQAYAEGIDAGRQEMRMALERQQGEFAALVANLDLFCKDLDAKLAEEVLTMSLELTRLIVRQSLRVSPELLLPLLREALGSLPGVSPETTLHLHPDDAALLRQVAHADAGSPATWKVLDDPSIERGGCRIETATTEVDATLETRWKRVIAAIGRDDAWMAGSA